MTLPDDAEPLDDGHCLCELFTLYPSPRLIFVHPLERQQLGRSRVSSYDLVLPRVQACKPVMV